MKTAKYNDFIVQNTAFKDSVKIGVYDRNDKRVGEFNVQGLKFPNIGEKAYSFGALSDVHISQDTAETDFQTALSYLQDVENVEFICICGDLTQYNQDTEYEAYASCVSRYSANTPVYPISGNHDCYGSGLTDARFQQYTGHGTFYTFTQGDDVFIMLSQIAWSNAPFARDGLQLLYDTLEANRDKRCFVFQHLFPWGKSGDPLELYSSDSLSGDQGKVLYSLMEHYTNAIWFHGHSHHIFESQSLHDKANYDYDFGSHSIHIPSIALPVNIASGERVTITEGSQGYIVDVYDNHIVLRGRDFSTGKFLPIATYCLNTSLKPIEAGTYTDDTGIITI